ncbi:uncharacterized protein UDID_08700 [Ustilago sp. UG-2017a]|nr:uncharacterized protein UDID_08700 [Ustilago sp. UG-2017a]
MSSLYPIPLGIATNLGYSGYRKGSLSLDGALTAAVVGYATMANPFIGYGLTLITFYLVGSKATRFKASIKAQHETHPPAAPTVAIEKKDGKRKRDTTSGNRNAVQVLCNSLTAVVACVAFRALNRRDGVDPLGKEVLTVWRGIDVSNLLLTLVVGGHYAACMADTLASELGILSKGQPRLVTNPTRKVPRGTNGGVSPLGLTVSALGGTLIGLVQTASLAVHYHLNPPLPTSSITVNAPYFKLIALFTAAGFTGSLIDSVLGATVQQTLYSATSKKVLVGSIRDVIQGNKDDAPEPIWERIAGADVLDNNAVNFLASAITAVGTAWVGLRYL